jgi:excisionase family DNA binding protein
VEDVGRLLTAAQVAERLGYTERYVWRLGREGVLPRIKLPGRKYVRFAERDVDRFVTRHRRDAIASGRRPAATRSVVARRF